jgi:hypothetical protein
VTTISANPSSSATSSGVSVQAVAVIAALPPAVLRKVSSSLSPSTTGLPASAGSPFFDSPAISPGERPAALLTGLAAGVPLSEGVPGRPPRCDRRCNFPIACDSPSCPDPCAGALPHALPSMGPADLRPIARWPAIDLCLPGTGMCPPEQGDSLRMRKRMAPRVPESAKRGGRPSPEMTYTPASPRARHEESTICSMPLHPARPRHAPIRHAPRPARPILLTTPPTAVRLVPRSKVVPQSRRWA